MPDMRRSTEALRLTILVAGFTLLWILMQAPSEDVLASPERYFEEVPSSAMIRSINMSAEAGGPGEILVKLTLQGLKLAEICSTETEGLLEGHVHVFVDGIKHLSMYAPEVTLTDIPPGQHELTVSFSRPPTHRVVSVNGVPLSQSLLITTH